MAVDRLKIPPTSETQFAVPESISDYLREIGVAAFSIYWAICRHANEESAAIVPLRQMAEGVGTSLSTARKAVHTLEQVGLIAVNRRFEADGGRGANEYVLLEFPDRALTTE